MRRRRLWPFGICLMALLVGFAMNDSVFTFWWIVIWLLLAIPAYKLAGQKSKKPSGAENTEEPKDG